MALAGNRPLRLSLQERLCLLLSLPVRSGTLPPSFIQSETFSRLDLPGWAVGSDGSWRGAFGTAQRQIPARVASHGELRTGFSIRAASVVVCRCTTTFEKRPTDRPSRGASSASSWLVAEFAFMRGTQG